MSKMGLLELLRQLEADHQPDRHLYRGQVRRYPKHRWAADDGQHEVEGLYPSDFRFHYAEGSVPAARISEITNRVSASRAYERDVRDEFIIFLRTHLRQLPASTGWAQDQLADWLRSLQSERAPLHDAHFFRMAWSLAQHYVVATALTDLTFDVRVAGWFAANPWDSKKPGPNAGDIGVIYRFHRAKLESVLASGTLFARAFADAQGLARPPELFLVDIREIPSTVACRPSAQQGASVYGFDQPHVVAGAMHIGAVEVFEFEHCPGIDIGLSRDDITPPDDPFLGPLSQFEAHRKSVRPKLTAPEGSDPSWADLVDRANTALRLGLRVARLCTTQRLSDDVLAATFDQIERHGQIPFRYLMLVAHKALRAFICAVTVEPIDLSEPLMTLPPEVLAEIGFGSDALRVWAVGGSTSVEFGHWPTLGEFTERALAVARGALQGSAPPPAS